MEEAHSLTSVLVNPPAIIEPSHDALQEVVVQNHPHDYQDNPPTSPATCPMQPTIESNEALTLQWRTLDLFTMLPLNRRAEAGAILEADPNKRQILELCRWGVYDCFTAMAKLGLPDPHLGDLSIRPGPLSEDHIEPTAWTGELPLPCLDCNHHFNGWCKNVPGSTGYNIKFIQRCVEELPERYVEPQQY